MNKESSIQLSITNCWCRWILLFLVPQTGKSHDIKYIRSYMPY